MANRRQNQRAVDERRVSVPRAGLRAPVASPVIDGPFAETKELALGAGLLRLRTPRGAEAPAEGRGTPRGGEGRGAYR